VEKTKLPTGLSIVDILVAFLFPLVPFVILLGLVLGKRKGLWKKWGLAVQRAGFASCFNSKANRDSNVDSACLD
jgi:hypothetical protein